MNIAIKYNDKDGSFEKHECVPYNKNKKVYMLEYQKHHKNKL